MDKISGKSPEINQKKNTNTGRFLYNLGQNPFDQSKEPNIQKDMENAKTLHPDLVSKSDTSNGKAQPEWGYFGASMGLCGDFSPNMIRVVQEASRRASEKDGKAESQSESSPKK